MLGNLSYLHERLLPVLPAAIRFVEDTFADGTERAVIAIVRLQGVADVGSGPAGGLLIVW